MFTQIVSLSLYIYIYICKMFYGCGQTLRDQRVGIPSRIDQHTSREIIHPQTKGSARAPMRIRSVSTRHNVNHKAHHLTSDVYLHVSKNKSLSSSSKRLTASETCLFRCFTPQCCKVCGRAVNVCARAYFTASPSASRFNACRCKTAALTHREHGATPAAKGTTR